MFLFILATLLSLWLAQHYRATRKWFQLPHPGFYVPGVSKGLKTIEVIASFFQLGHFLRFLNRAMAKDPIQGLWDMWKRHQKGGLLWFRCIMVEKSPTKHYFQELFI